MHEWLMLSLVVRLDQHGGHNRHARLDPAVLADEADLLGVGLLALQTELGPGREDESRKIAGLRRLAGPRVWLRV